MPQGLWHHQRPCPRNRTPQPPPLWVLRPPVPTDTWRYQWENHKDWMGGFEGKIYWRARGSREPVPLNQFGSMVSCKWSLQDSEHWITLTTGWFFGVVKFVKNNTGPSGPQRFFSAQKLIKTSVLLIWPLCNAQLETTWSNLYHHYQ